MRSMKSERGAISAGLIVGILLVVFAAYEAKQFGPLLMSQFQFQDFVIEASKFSATKDTNSLTTELVQKAAEFQLPITREMVNPWTTDLGANVLLPNWDAINPVLLEMFAE